MNNRRNNFKSESTPSYSYPQHSQSRNSTPANTSLVGKVLPPPLALVPVRGENNSNRTVEDYRDITFSKFSLGKSVKDLTHPSDIRKRIRAAKQSRRSFQGESSVEDGVGLMETPPKKRRKLEDQQQWDVSRHLAALRRKQKCLMERDSQEVPTSPQVDPAPGDFPSLHSSQSTKETRRSVAKRVLFTSDQHLVSSSTNSGSFLDFESSSSSSSSSSSDNRPGRPLMIPRGIPEAHHHEVIDWEPETSSYVPSLEGYINSHQLPLQFAQVPVLQPPHSLLRPHLTSPPPTRNSTSMQLAPPSLSSHHHHHHHHQRRSCTTGGSHEPRTQDDATNFNILHVFPREE